MLQRIQTLYLVLALAVGVCWFFLPSALLQGGAVVYVLSGAGLVSEKGLYLYVTLPLPVLNATCCALSLIAIFRYGNRPYQVRLCRLSMLLCACDFALAVLLSRLGMALSVFPEGASVAYRPGMVLPLLALLLLWMAAWRIRKDEELVRSVDRLR